MERLFLMFLDHTQRRTTISAGERPQAAHLLRSWVRIPPGARIFVCCECRVLSGRGLCDELITRPEESYRMWCVVVCDLETSRIGAPYIISFSSLSYDRSKASSIASSPHSAIQSFLFQMTVYICIYIYIYIYIYI